MGRRSSCKPRGVWRPSARKSCGATRSTLTESAGSCRIRPTPTCWRRWRATCGLPRAPSVSFRCSKSTATRRRLRWAWRLISCGVRAARERATCCCCRPSPPASPGARAFAARRAVEAKRSACMGFSRETVAEAYLRGEGIEIGALHMPLRVPEAARVKYVDRMDVEGLRTHYPELGDQEIVNVDIIADGERLESVSDATQDFVIANHFIEHCQDPIGALLNMFRVLKPGGVLYLAIPDKRCSFDVDRPVTTLDHL